ncbi:MAG: MFS transporter [Patescibacteria group bacterium]
MFNTFRANLPHYFSKHPSRELKELYWSVGLQDFATSAIALFEPIYLFTRGYSITEILFFYAAVYFGYTVLIPFGGRIAAHFGFEHTILYSQFAYIAYYLALFALPYAPWLIFVAPIIFAIQKSLYWPAYHADFATFSAREQRGSEVSGMLTVNAAVTTIGPIVGGLVLKFFGFGPLFVIVAILLLASTVPLFQLKEVYDPAPFSYRTYWKLLWKPSHRRSAIAYLGFAEELVALVLWPVFIYLVVSEYSKLGLLVALSTLITSVVVLGIGKLSDHVPKLNILRFGSLAAAFVWVLRAILTLTPLRFIWLDTAGRTSKNLVVIPLMAMTYEHGVREDPLAIAVFFEQALAIGKCGVALLLIVLASFMDIWVAAFLTAAVASGLYALLKPPGPLGQVHSA